MPAPRRTEELLALEAQLGDAAASEELCRRLRPWVAQLARRHASLYMPAEDLTQEGLIGVLEAAGKFAYGRHALFRTYAYRIVKGRIIDAMRAKGSLVRTPRHSPMSNIRQWDQPSHSEVRDTHQPWEPEASPTPEEQRREQLERLADLLVGLSPRERFLMLCYYAEGMSMRQIGEQLDLSESRVSQLHTAICERLRERLTKEKETYGPSQANRVPDRRVPEPEAAAARDVQPPLVSGRPQAA